MREIKADCDPRYRAVHDSGPRKKEDIKYVVIHCTQGDTAESAASWFTNPKSTGSANLVVDEDICSDHTDPGPNFPWDVFMGLVKRYYAQMAL